MLAVRLLRSFLLMLAVMTAAALPAQAADPIDWKTVPQMPGATELTTFPETLLYMSPETVDATGRKLRDLMTADGWHLFDLGEVYESQTADSYEQQDFVKGAYAISVYVTAAPAKENRTSVQYGMYPVASPMPVPKDATKLVYRYDKARMACESAQSADALFEFYKTELKALGWTRFAPPEANAPIEPGKTIRAHFIKDDRDPIKLIVHPEEPGRTIVDIQSEAHADMIAAYAPKPKPPEPVAEEKAEVPPVAEKEDEDTDAKFAELVQGLVKEAMKPVEKPKKAEVAAADLVVTPLGLLAGNTAPIPVPDTATEIEHDGEDGTLEFETASNVKSIAAFYREQLKAGGWKEKKGILDSERLTSLDMRKGKEDRLNFTIHRMGTYTDVSIRGDSLKVAAAPEAQAASPVDAAVASPDGAAMPPGNYALPPEDNAGTPPPPSPEKQLALADLEVSDQGGLPVPKPHSYSGRTKSKFFHSANALVAASIETTVAFYRRELEKRGWKEDAAAAAISADAATLNFTTDEGPAIVKLAAKDGETTVEITVREKAKAEASGLMPKAGQAKIMLGSILEETAEVTINKTKFKVKPGETADTKSSPQIELAPGKYQIAVKVKGKPAKGEELEVGADQIWGVLIGPGGTLSLPMY